MRRPKRRITAQMIKRLDRYVNLFYLWRYMEDGHPQNELDHHGWRQIIPNDLKRLVYSHVIAHRRYWHCATITYCRDPFGKEYHLLGYARTVNPIKIEGEGFRPLATAANKIAEDNCNEKHVYARAVVAAPVTRGFPSLEGPLLSVRKALSLTDEDIQGIIAMQEEKGETIYTWDEDDFSDDIDKQIAAYL